jgi:hypothetical protein
MQHGCEKDQHYIEIMDRFDPFPFFDHLIRFVGFIWFYDVIPVISLLSTYKKKPMIYPISPFVSHSYIPWNSMKPTVFWAQILFRTSPSGSYWSKTCRWWDNIDHIKHPPWHEYIPYDIFWGVEYTYIYICIHIYIYVKKSSISETQKSYWCIGGYRNVPLFNSIYRFDFLPWYPGWKLVAHGFFVASRPLGLWWCTTGRGWPGGRWVQSPDFHKSVPPNHPFIYDFPL